jgi:phosphatidylglycerol:prolipoprotein diacylglycerol transferase
MHPVLFQLGPLTIYSYGVCVAAAFLLAIITAAARARRYGWSADVIYDISLYILVASLIGSRLLYVIETPDEFIQAPWEVFMIWRGGLVYYGGVIAAVIAAIVYLKKHRLSVGKGFDLLVPSLALGHAVGRVGCLLNGCCFGKVSFLPWAIRFPKGSPVYFYQLYVEGSLPPGSARSLPVHPTQIYSSIMELFIFVVLATYLPRKKFDGQIFWLYILLYGAGRFFVEFFRADNPAVKWLGVLDLSVPQLMSLAAIVVSAPILILGVRGRRKAA